MEKIFDIAKDKEQSWGTLATAIDGNFDEIRLQINMHHGEDYTEELTDNNMHIETGFPIGTTISLEPTSGGGYVYIVLDCKQGDKYIVSGRGGSKPRTYAFVDSSNVLQKVSDAGESLEDSILIAPCDGKIIYNCDKTHTPKKVYKVGVIEDNLAEINNKIESECLKKSLTRTSNLFNSKEYRYDGYYDDSQEFIKSETYSSSSAISVKQGNTYIFYAGSTPDSFGGGAKRVSNASGVLIAKTYSSSITVPSDGGEGCKMYFSVQNASKEEVERYMVVDSAIEVLSYLPYYKTDIDEAIKEYVNNKSEDFDAISISAKMYNPVINFSKDELRVLDIGNSYTQDSMRYLADIVENLKLDTSKIAVYRGMRSSASFKTWWDCYYNRDEHDYTFHKVFGELSVDISGTHGNSNGELFRNVLTNNKWDVIIIHQSSSYAPYFDAWENNSESGHLSDFIRLIRKHQPQAAIGTLLVHSYQSTYSGNTEKSTIKRWKKIANSVARLKMEYGIDFIIPYGTAIENLRASSLNNEMELTEDGVHCAEGLPMYCASCCYYQALFAPRYGISIFGNTLRLTSSAPHAINVTDSNAPIAQKAAISSCCNMWECINPETIEL